MRFITLMSAAGRGETSHRNAIALLVAALAAAALAVTLIAPPQASAALQPASQWLDPYAGYNGCGPRDGWIRYIIPDGVPLTTIEWTKACDRHDLCYETLRADKWLCDADLGRDVAQLCRDTGGIFCDRIGALYKWAVTEYGDEAYDAAQETALMRCIRRPDLYASKPGYCPNADTFMWMEICAVNILPDRYTPNRRDSCQFNVPDGGWWTDNAVAYNPEAVRANMAVYTANDGPSLQHYFKLRLAHNECITGPAPQYPGRAVTTLPGGLCEWTYGRA
jgi:hypothetical protein